MNKKIKIVIIGAGGHAKSCLDVASRISKIEIIGFIDNNIKIGAKVNGIEILGNDSIIPHLVNENYYFIIGVGQIKTAIPRINLFKKLNSLNAKIYNLIATSAIISKSVNFGVGMTVMEGAKLGPNVTLGNGVIINTNAIIEHGSRISDFCHISTSAVINGDCKIESNTFIGSGSVIRQGVSVSGNSIIKMGSRIFKDV